MKHQRYKIRGQSRAERGKQKRGVSFPLALKMAFSIAVLMSIILFALWSLISYSSEKLLNAQASAYGHSIARLAADSSAEAVMAEDRLQLQVLANHIARDDYILSATIYSADGEKLASSEPHISSTQTSATESSSDATADVSPDDSPASVLAQALSPAQAKKAAPVGVPFMEEIRYRDVRAGFVSVTLDKTMLENPVHQHLYKISAATVIMAILAVAAAFWLGRRLARPIDRLVSAARRLQEDHHKGRIREDRNDEIGQLIRALNGMAENLEKKNVAEEALSRFVSPAVAHQLLGPTQQGEYTQGTLVQGSVMFIDMVGFTAMSESIPPKQVADLVNHYFSLINKACKLYNGTVDKYLGDGAMLVFGAPQADEEHRFHAMCCARLFLQLIEHNAHPDAPCDIRFRVAIHSGEMIAGTMGSDDRMQYTVMGDAVNLAARLCEQAPSNGILVTDEVLDFSDLRQRVITAELPPMPIRGKVEPVQPHQLLDLNDPYRQLLQRQTQHLQSKMEQVQ